MPSRNDLQASRRMHELTCCVGSRPVSAAGRSSAERLWRESGTPATRIIGHRPGLRPQSDPCSAGFPHLLLLFTSPYRRREIVESVLTLRPKKKEAKSLMIHGLMACKLPATSTKGCISGGQQISQCLGMLQELISSSNTIPDKVECFSLMLSTSSIILLPCLSLSWSTLCGCSTSSSHECP